MKRILFNLVFKSSFFTSFYFIYFKKRYIQQSVLLNKKSSIIKNKYSKLYLFRISFL